MSFYSHLAQWSLRGVVNIATGLLPLFITSESVLAWWTTFGAGWLTAFSLASFFGTVTMGTAVATLSPAGSRFLPVALAITHIAGVLFMLVVERRIFSRALEHSQHEWGSDTSPSPTSVAYGDATGLKKRQETEDTRTRASHALRTTRASGPHQHRIYLFIFAFVVGEIVAGISDGYEAMAPLREPNNASDEYRLPVLVTEFFGSVLRAATALGFVTTLLSACLPIAECRRYVLLYGMAHPLSALFSYTMTGLLRFAPTGESKVSVIILIVKHLSVGFFVYAALIVRALIVNSRTITRSGLLARIITMVVGALLPYILPRLLLGVLYVCWAASRGEAQS